MAAASPVPLAARGLGARLERALAIRAGTSEPLVLDRSGEPVATRQRDGVLRPLATGTPEVVGVAGADHAARTRPDPTRRAPSA